jgi:cytochrome c-type biogenesis protein CcmH/NrfF
MQKFSLLCFLLLLFLLPLSAQAQIGGEDLPAGVTGEDVYRVSSQMYCDVCQGVPISSCPSPTCLRWRQEIANLLGDGRSDQEIMEFFAATYGDDVTGVPLQNEDRGLALGLPLLLSLVIGAAVLGRVWLLGQRGGPTKAQLAAEAAGLNPNYQRPVPNNVDPVYLERFLGLLEDKR